MMLSQCHWKQAMQELSICAPVCAWLEKNSYTQIKNHNPKLPPLLLTPLVLCAQCILTSTCCCI